jgi:hypothetical protein
MKSAFGLEFLCGTARAKYVFLAKPMNVVLCGRVWKGKSKS